MKNLKKLDRNELKTISGNGLLDPIGGLLGGLGGVVGGVVGGVGTIVGDVVTGVGTLVGNALCQTQCVINGVIHIRLLECGSTC
ncbi:bacteriocin-like protein [Chryseobacterium rhizosphaerae]|jgi:phage-related protein|uniref:bacteriocin-like protein n=1 Tax=Chryseobacterium rhizosphaerae TaxID=395937 RepID=UPI001194CCEF|nr:hypothetical protein [Chryseobacterium rhizosphaerae]MDC8100165.1 hypothetical protein [Chryseobacterium rhizosphaerae]MDR6548174.1 phage-related protein [Chryseobacterium rhizosphaerae]GEN69239.1 hypothetical protein CRH01_38070 [Chryseobacterium rhizosphaerae]